MTKKTTAKTTAKVGDVATGDGWELRCGDYRDVLANEFDFVVADAVITDPPYSERTHSGHSKIASKNDCRSIDYDYLTHGDAMEWAANLSSMSAGWVCVLTDHTLVSSWEKGFKEAGRYAFAPIPCIERGGRFRMIGDGPPCVTVNLVPARPRTREDGAFPYWNKWHKTPAGYYITTTEDKLVIGGKTLALMRAIVRDYSRRGELVVDPCAGGGTTLLAAVLEGRRAIGAELDPATFELAVARLRRGYTPTFDFGT